MSSLGKSNGERSSASRQHESEPLPKKRRMNKACDICRQRKVRCDGPDMPSNECSYCAEHKIECTYSHHGKKARPLALGYYKQRAQRAEKLEALFKQLMPDVDLAKELDDLYTNKSSTSDPPTPNEALNVDTSASALPFFNGRETSQSKAMVQPDTMQDALLLPDDFSRMRISNGRFYGKSSSALLIQQAMDLKMLKSGNREDVVTGILQPHKYDNWRSGIWDTGLPDKDSFEGQKPSSRYTFPDDEFMLKLIDIYFEECNLFNPLLHRPTFDKYVSDKLHLYDDSFGAVLMLVCAIAARWCDDPRVFHLGHESGHSRGWKWFDQVKIQTESILAPASIHDIQMYALMAEYICGSSSPQGGWTIVGLGLRAAQDVGAHWQRMYASPLTIEKELWRRAWWVLVKMDRNISAGLGRPLGLHDDEFDVELPTDCDDEYWEHPDPAKAWTQPAGKPSVVAFFVWSVKLTKILSRTLQTVYALDKAKLSSGFLGEEWEQKIVAELDSSLNLWIDSLPEHLRWNPHCEDETWFRQSVLLHASYYLVQILVHLPFISTKASPLSFPSLAICTNAARACSHLVDPKDPRLHPGMSHLVWPMFLSAIILLLNVWGGKKLGLEIDAEKAMKDILTCQEIMKSCESRFVYSGRLWDIFHRLSSIGFASKDDGTSGGQNASSENTETDPFQLDLNLEPSEVPKTATLRKLHEHSLQTQFQTLPLSTNDLMRLPLFPSSNGQPGNNTPSYGIPSLDGEDAPFDAFGQPAVSFGDDHGHGAYGMFDGMPANVTPQMLHTFGNTTVSPIQSHNQEGSLMYDNDSMLFSGWQQPSTSSSIGQNSWESYLSNVTELLKDIDSWDPSRQ